MNEVTDVCCMHHIFACLGYSRFFILKVCRHHVGFPLHSQAWYLLIHRSVCRLWGGFWFTLAILTLPHLLIYMPPSSGLSIHIGDLNACSLVSLYSTFERAFNVSIFGIPSLISYAENERLKSCERCLFLFLHIACAPGSLGLAFRLHFRLCFCHFVLAPSPLGASFLPGYFCFQNNFVYASTIFFSP
jgi:hypothetical protein